MRHGSLFSGIGGFDLAAEWMGWDNVFHCEWNQFGQKILKHYWPNSISYGDITKTDFTIHRGKIDILTGGFPCQPYSLAGKRKGKEDDRHLWPEMLRAIREIQPSWIVGENVYGLVNWNGGMVFHEVQTDLEAEGYEVFPFILPACAKNAPHRRDRVWFVAHSNNNGQHGCDSENEINTSERWEYAQRNTKQSDGNGNAAHTKRIRQQRSRRPEGQGSAEAFRNWEASWINPNGGWPTQSPLCSGNDGVSAGLDGITISKHRKESLMAYGNAIVPQVVYQIFKIIELYEKNINPGLSQPHY